MQTIERILEKQEIARLKKEKVEQLSEVKFPGNLPAKMLKMKKDLLLSGLLKKDVSKVLEQLLTPEKNDNLPVNELLKKKGKKKKHHHL